MSCLSGQPSSPINWQVNFCRYLSIFLGAKTVYRKFNLIQLPPKEHSHKGGQFNMFISLLIFSIQNKQVAPWISIATCQKHSHSHSHVWQMYPHATCSTGLWAPSPPFCLPLLLPPLKTYVKWQKIKYPVVKMRFSDKCDTHATAGQANKHTNTHTHRERDKQTNQYRARSRSERPLPRLAMGSFVTVTRAPLRFP